MNLKNIETKWEPATDPSTFSLSPSLPPLSFSAQWDAINEMDEYFSPIHTYQVSNVLSV